jgi:hypothetical protein
MAIIPLFAMVNHISAASRKEYESAPVGFGITRQWIDSFTSDAKI